MASGGYAVRITAEDAASGSINRINAALARLLQPVERLNAAQAGLASGGMSASLSALESRFTAAARGAGSLADGVARALPGIGTLTGAASIAGLARLTAGFASSSASLVSMSNRLGISATSLAQWQGAARLANVSAEAMSGGLRTFRDTLNDAVTGRNDRAASMLNALRVNFEAGALQARNFEEVLPEIADKIAAIRDVSTRAMVVRELFGTEDMFGFLSRGATSIAQLRAEAANLAPVTEEQARTGNDLQTSLNRLGLAATGLSDQLTSRLAPGLRSIADATTEWMRATDGARGALDRLPASFSAWEIAGGAAAGMLSLRLIPPLTRYAGLLAVTGLIRVPSATMAALGIPGVAPAIAGAAIMAPTTLNRGEREELDAIRNDPERLAREMNGTSPPRPVQGPSVFDRVDALLRRHFTPPARPPLLPSPLRDLPGSPPTDLLGLIGRAEGTDRGRGYNETLGYGAYTGGARELTGMTLDQIDALQQEMLRHPGNHWRSSAVGRYQIVRTTLQGLRRQLGLRGDEMFDAAMQDRLATALLERRGLSRFQAGRMTPQAFQASIAREWASIPDPTTGQGFYANQRRPGVDQGTVNGVFGRLTPGAPLTLGPNLPVAGATQGVLGVVETRVIVQAPPGTVVETTTEGAVVAPPARVESNAPRGRLP